MSFICIIASFVTAVDYLIMAISLELHRSLGAFIALIVVNCLILGRAEAFASKNTIGRSVLAAEALRLMEERKITALVVIDGRGAAEGVVHLHDLWRTQLI